jgi:hypothetical protein
VAHGVLGNAQDFRRLAPGHALRGEPEHLDLAIGETCRPGSRWCGDETGAEVLAHGVDDFGIEDAARFGGEAIKGIRERQGGFSGRIVGQLIQAIRDGDDPGAQGNITAAAAAEVPAAIDVLMVVAD